MISWNDSATKCQHQRRRCRLHAIPEKKPVTRDWLVSMWPSSISAVQGPRFKIPRGQTCDLSQIGYQQTLRQKIQTSGHIMDAIFRICASTKIVIEGSNDFRLVTKMVQRWLALPRPTERSGSKQLADTQLQWRSQTIQIKKIKKEPCL